MDGVALGISLPSFFVDHNIIHLFLPQGLGSMAGRPVGGTYRAALLQEPELRLQASPDRAAEGLRVLVAREEESEDDEEIVGPKKQPTKVRADRPSALSPSSSE